MGRPAFTPDIKHETLRHLDLALAACELGLVRSGERNSASEAASESFRHLHSSKAIAALLKSHGVALLLHGAETAASLLRRKEEPEIRAHLRAWRELLSAVRRAVQSGRTLTASNEVKRFVERISHTSRASGVPHAAALLARVALDRDALGAFTEFERHRLAANLRARVPVAEIRVQFAQADFAARVEELRNRLMAVGEVIAMLPSIDAGGGETISFRIVVATRESDESLALLSPAAPIAVRNLLRSAPPVFRPDEPAARAAEMESPMVGEANIELARFSAATRASDLSTLLSAHLSALSVRFKTSSHLTSGKRDQLSKKAARLAVRVNRAALVPARTVAELAAASATLAARELSRDVSLEVEPLGVLLPAPLADSISIALVHLVRNVVVHAAASPEHRPIRCEIRFRETESMFEVTVADNGTGLDPARIRAAAERAGIELPASARRAEILRMVFDERLTEAREASLLAGRGAGLAAVKKSAEELRGTAAVHSRKNRGTTFRLRFPRPRPSLTCLIAESHHRCFAVPLATLSAIISLPSGGGPLASIREFRYRNRRIAVSRLPRGSSGSRGLDSPAASQVLLLTRESPDRGLSVNLLGIARQLEISPLPGGKAIFPGALGLTRWRGPSQVPVLDVVRFLTSAS